LVQNSGFKYYKNTKKTRFVNSVIQLYRSLSCQRNRGYMVFGFLIDNNQTLKT